MPGASRFSTCRKLRDTTSAHTFSTPLICLMCNSNSKYAHMTPSSLTPTTAIPTCCHNGSIPHDSATVCPKLHMLSRSGVTQTSHLPKHTESNDYSLLHHSPNCLKHPWTSPPGGHNLPRDGLTFPCHSTTLEMISTTTDPIENLHPISPKIRPVHCTRGLDHAPAEYPPRSYHPRALLQALDDVTYVLSVMVVRPSMPGTNFPTSME